MKHRLLSRTAGFGLTVALTALPNVAAPQQSLTNEVQRASIETLNALDLLDGTVQELVLPPQAGAPIETSLFVEGAWRNVVLEPYSVRAPDFRLLVQTADGSVVEEMPPPVATYRGVVEGYPESGVAASLLDGQLSGTMRLRDGEPLWGIQPLSQFEPGASKRAHVVYDSRDSQPLDGVCATDSLPHLGDGVETSAVSGGGGGTNFKVCQIACDADVEFYQWNGSSVPATENDIENVINGVSLIYVRDVEIIYQITTILVRTSEPDPYSSSSPGTLLFQFDQHWTFNQGGIVRDIAHLFTGRNLDGSVIGIASLSVICSQNQGYGLVESNFSSQLSGRVGLSSHELGHNWSAQHCDGLAGCQIMCSGLGGCGGTSAFGPNAKNSITNKKNSSGCLSNPPAPTLTTVVPGTGIQPLSGAKVTVNGTAFFSAQAVQVGGVVLGDGQFNVVSDTKLTFTAPQPTALGSNAVTVTNQTATTNAGALTYLATDPPVMIVPISLPQGQALTWQYAAGAGEVGIVWVSGSSVTFPFNGVDVLLNGVLLFSQFLDPVGLGSVTFPLNLPFGTILYSQLLTFDGVDLGGSDVELTVISF